MVVNGETYSQSIFHGLSECNGGGGVGYVVEYYLGRKYSRLEATAGLSDLDTKGARTVEFRLTTDHAHDYFALGRGASRKVSFNVKGELYLRLSVYEKNGSGPCIVDTMGVWSDAELAH